MKRIFDLVVIKNITLLLASVAISLLISNLLASLFLDQYKTSKSWIMSDVDIEIYRKYENRLNHLRDFTSWRAKASHTYTDDPNNLIFNQFSNEYPQDKVLITGDSWGEKFALDLKSFQTLEQYSRNSNVNITISGTGSYSPTLLGIQGRILNSDFGLTFDKAFIVIDNTDIGNELCSYKDVIYQDVEGLVNARAFVAEDNQAVFNHQTMLRVSEIINSENLSLVKLFQLSLKKLNNYIYRETEPNCGWSQISHFLTDGMEEEELAYFNSTLDYLVEELRSTNQNMTIYLITIPHRGHVTGEYVLSTGSVIAEYLHNTVYSNLFQLDLTEKINSLLNAGYQLDDIFIADDLSSHLTSFAHNELLVPLVLSKINNEE
jgi:hypothetical protein